MAKVLPNASGPARLLADALLQLDPHDRPRAAEALCHEFFSALPAACSAEELRPGEGAAVPLRTAAPKRGKVLGPETLDFFVLPAME